MQCSFYVVGNTKSAVLTPASLIKGISMSALKSWCLLLSKLSLSKNLKNTAPVNRDRHQNFSSIIAVSGLHLVSPSWKARLSIHLIAQWKKPANDVGCFSAQSCFFSTYGAFPIQHQICAQRRWRFFFFLEETSHCKKNTFC